MPWPAIAIARVAWVLSPALSVTVTSIEADEPPATTGGVPEISPPLLTAIHPHDVEGVHDVSDHVYGARPPVACRVAA